MTTLITMPVGDIAVTATPIGQHFAIHPAVLIDETTGEMEQSTVEWCLQHRPSGQLLATLMQQDPEEWPGEPRALNLDRIRAFIAWLESRIDTSTPAIDFTTLTRQDLETIQLFRGDPNYFTVPATPPVKAAPRPWTPDRTNPDGSTTVTVKTSCPHCGRVLGDATTEEIEHAIHRKPLIDVSSECGCRTTTR